jgi:hypothetical protein
MKNFNGGLGTFAKVALTGPNVIAGGSALNMVATGVGYTGAPTTATLFSGTATCSGTATIASVLGSYPAFPTASQTVQGSIVMPGSLGSNVQVNGADWSAYGFYADPGAVTANSGITGAGPTVLGGALAATVSSSTNGPGPDQAYILSNWYCPAAGCDRFLRPGGSAGIFFNINDATAFGEGGAGDVSIWTAPTGTANTHIPWARSFHIFAATGNTVIGNGISNTGTDDGAHGVQVNGGFAATGDITLNSHPYYNPLDTSMMVIDEDFVPSTNSSGYIGAYGWNSGSIVAGCTTSGASGGAPNLGIWFISSDSISGHGCNFALDYGSPNMFGSSMLNFAWDSYWIFAPISATTSEQIRVGYIPVGNATALPVSGYFVRYDTTLATPDTNYMLCVDAASTESCYSTGVAFDLAYHKVRIRRVNATTVGMTFYNNVGGVQMAEKTFCPSGCNVTATLAATALTPGVVIATATIAARVIQVDAFKFMATGLSR